MDFGMANVLAITVLVYLAGMGLKVSKLEDKWIPLLCGTIGLILGLAAFFLGMPDFPAADPLTAAAVGTAYGLASTGVHQAYKQLTEKGE